MSEMSAGRFIIPLHSNSIVKFLHLVGTRFNELSNSVAYIPQDKYVARTAQRHLDHENLHLDYLNYRPTADFESLCDKYGIDSPRNLVFPQMVYDRSYDAPSHRPYWLSGTNSLQYKEYRELLHRTLEYLDELYENDNGGIPLQYQGGEVLRRVLQRVANYHEYPSVRTSFSPVPGRVLFRSTEEMHFPALEAANYDDMTPKEREDARKFRASVTENQQQVIGHSRQSKSLYQNLRRKARRIQEHRDDLTPVISNWLRRHAVKPLLGAAAKRLYLDEGRSREFIESNKYVFYPLQYFRESRVTMRAPEFYNQLWLIEYLSRSLPPEYELVVKDHPGQLGALPLSHAYKLRRYATGVAPTVPAREVVTGADAVVTLNNTVGYEAIMYGKPVVVLDDAFYSGAGYTRDVGDLDLLSTRLNEAVRSDGIGGETTLEFAHGLLEASYQGKWGKRDSNNIRRFTQSLLEFAFNKQ